jgi:hypothetical protein
MAELENPVPPPRFCHPEKLRAYILLLHAKTQRDGFPERHRNGEPSVTPNVRGVASAMDKLRHELDDMAGKLLARVEETGKRGVAAFEKAHERLSASDSELKEVEDLVAGMEQSNGGPTSGG